jgi:ribosomal-protein-alanine N-acetyltransferase
MKISDAPFLFAFWSDPIVTKFMNIEPFQTIEETEEMIMVLTNLALKNRAIRYSILLKESNQIIGSCGFNYMDHENARAEIGYDLGKDFWGKGYASEAILNLINDGFNERNINRIEAKVDPQHSRSIKVLEKLGFSLEGTLRQYERSKDTFIDLHMFSKLKNE